jgi:hypothetical protein
MFFKIIIFPKIWSDFPRDSRPKRQYRRSITRPVLEYEALFPYMLSAHPTHGIIMRISLADSRTNGFKKWSDAQRPPERPAPADMPEPRRQKGESTHLDAELVGDGM